MTRTARRRVRVGTRDARGGDPARATRAAAPHRGGDPPCRARWAPGRWARLRRTWWIPLGGLGWGRRGGSRRVAEGGGGRAHRAMGGAGGFEACTRKQGGRWGGEQWKSGRRGQVGRRTWDREGERCGRARRLLDDGRRVDADHRQRPSLRPQPPLLLSACSPVASRRLAVAAPAPPLSALAPCATPHHTRHSQPLPLPPASPPSLPRRRMTFLRAPARRRSA